jgi:hypothetical protein
MQAVLFDAPVPGWSPGGSYGHPRLLSCSFVMWQVHLLPGGGSAYGTRGATWFLRCRWFPGEQRRHDRVHETRSLSP